MYVSDASQQFALEQAAAQPLVGELRDFDLSYQLALADGRARLQSVSGERGLARWYDDYVDDIYRQTGQRLSSPFSFSGFSLPGPDATAGEDFAARLDAFDADVKALAVKHRDVPVKSFSDAQAAVAAAARATKAAVERPIVSTGWSGLGSFVGYGQAALEDPANIAATIATLGLGGGEAAGAVAAARATLATRLAAAARPVLATTLREGVVNAATEAAIQPSVLRFNRSSGIDYSVADAAEQVAMAGAAGGVVGGGLHVAGMGLKGVLGKWRDAKAAGHVAADAETDAAERVLSDAAAMRAANPYPGVEGGADFDAAHAQALHALTRGNPLPPDLDARYRAHRAAALDGLASGNGTDVAFYGVVDHQQTERLFGALHRDGDGDFLGYPVRRMDATGLRHALNKHGKDPIPFLPEHARLIPDVVEGGEVVESIANQSMLSRRLIDGNWLYVAERVSSEQKPNLTFKTAYWTRGPKDGGGGLKGAPPRDARFTGSMADRPETDGADGKSRPAGDSPVTPNMRAVRTERKALPPELAPPASRPPETLVGWLKRQGGINDADGWLAHMGVDNTIRPGLLAARGMPLDDAALRAWEEGFFPEYHDRPSPDALRLQIANDLGPEGMDRVRGTDEGARLEWDHYSEMMAQIDRLGVDPYGKSWEDIQAAIRMAQTAQRDEDGLWRQALDFVNPQAAQALDDESAFVARVHGDLLAADVDIPTTAEVDGKPVMQSARDTIDAWDDEALTWDSALSCLGRG